MSTNPKSAAYKAVFEYLVENHDKDNPATPKKISESTGVSMPSVYRILTAKQNGDVGDETASAGIFIAPETRGQFGFKQSRCYYADPSRIEDSSALAAAADSLASKFPLPKPIKYYVLHGLRNLTPSIVRVVNTERDNAEAGIKANAGTRKILEVLLGTKEETKALWAKMMANYDATMNGGDPVDSALHRSAAQAIEEMRVYHADIVRLCDQILQDTVTDTNPFLLMDPERIAISPIHPVVRKVN